MKNLNTQPNKWIIRASLVAVLALAFVYAQMSLTKVSAQLLPVMVKIGHLEFGTVFPGQVLENNFTVWYGENNGLDSPYRLVQKIKPRPNAIAPDGYTGSISDYCQASPSDYDRCYRDLCPYLTKLSREGEGDIDTNAMVGLQDLYDNWIVHLEVPAIIGQVAQDNSGDPVSKNGEYGCDISVDVVEN
jgi:hypothetical protein